jgi:ketosteroid isomerase-like protein
MSLEIETREECAELIRQGYEALTRGDLDKIVELIHPEFQCDASGGLPHQRGDSGTRGFEGFLQDLSNEWDEFRCELQELRHAGELLVALVLEEGLERSTGRRIQRESFHIWALRENKAVRFGRHPRVPAAA